jgi:general secretion pathway protein M
MIAMGASVNGKAEPGHHGAPGWAAFRAGLGTAVGTRWARLSASERQWVAVGAVVVGLGLVWGLGVAPAWKSLQSAPQRLATLEAQNQQMRALASEAKALRATPAIDPAQALAALKVATERLGAGSRLNHSGDRAVLTFAELNGTALAAWLEEARAGARARPIDAQISRGPKGLSGVITVALPGAGG